MKIYTEPIHKFAQSGGHTSSSRTNGRPHYMLDDDFVPWLLARQKGEPAAKVKKLKSKPTEQELEDLYLNQMLTVHEIARSFQIANHTVGDLLKKFNIQARKGKTAHVKMK